MKEQTYLIFEVGGRVINAPKAAAMNHEAIRAELTRMYPESIILSPLERPTGPISVVTIYLSRSRDGKRRISSLEQWGVQ